MARDVSGTYTRVSNSFSDPVANTTIDPSDATALFDDIESEMTDSLSRTGKGGMSADLDMNNNDINEVKTVVFQGSTSGNTTVIATAIAGTTTLTLPAATDTLVGKATTDALTNKTINGNTITASTGTLTLAGGKTLGASNSMTLAGTDGTTITFQATDTYVGRTTTDTLTNKTLTNPVLTAPAIGAATGTSLALTGTSSSIVAAGRQGAIDPVFQVDASAASQATGLKVTGAAAGGGVAIQSISSGSNENLVFNALGTGQLIFGNVSTGAITLTRATTISAALTYGGVTLSNAVTGTGNMVLSSAPTLTLTNATGLPLATGVTGNLPVANAPVVSAFSVHKNGSDQTGVVSATLTLVTWGTELYDVGSNFASNAWTPPAGKVHLNATVGFTGTITAGANCQVVLNKNGAAFLQCGVNPITNTGSITISTDDIANGTDAYTVIVFITTSAGTATVTGAAINSRFSGHWISP